MRRQVFPLVPVLGPAAVLLAVLVAVAAPLPYRDALAQEASLPVGLALVLVTAVPVASFALPASRPMLVASGWWRLLAVGSVLDWSAHLLRFLAPDTLALTAVAGVLGLVGISLVLWGVVELERGRTTREPLDVVVDAAMLATSITLLVVCLVVRPLVGRPGFTPVSWLDLLNVLVAVVLAALLASSIVSGPLTETTSAWTGAGISVYALGFVVLSATDDRVLPLGTQLLWALSSVVLLAPLLVNLRRDTSDRLFLGPRWSPGFPALACIIPIGLYVWEATRPGDGGVPDAQVIGAVLVLLGIVCVWRVARFVHRVQTQQDELNDLARSDHLTGLANRRTADEELGRAFAASAADDEPVAVALCDLDHFKAFNDRYGHHAGDELLIGVARAWSACLGDGQLLARYGGEEFLLISSGLSPSGLAQVVDRMRRATPHGQSFSAGIASWDGSEEAVRLVARADAALYQAKAEGRGRTEIFYTRSLVEEHS